MAIALPPIVRTSLGHGIVYMHPRGMSSRVSCSSSNAVSEIGFGHGSWDVHLCFNGNRIPFEAFFDRASGYECVSGERHVNKLSACA